MSTIAKLSLKEYERIVATGVFDGLKKRRIELIRGELREMNPIGSDHAQTVDRLADWSYDSAPRAKVQVRVQNPLAFVTIESEPKPDIVWAKRKNYASGHPAADDVLLLIEVADSSLSTDCGEKSELYAEAGIQDYWIVNLVDRTVEVRRDPEAGRYRTARSYGVGDVVQPLAVPEARLSVDSLFTSTA